MLHLLFLVNFLLDQVLKKLFGLHHERVIFVQMDVLVFGQQQLFSPLVVVHKFVNLDEGETPFFLILLDDIGYLFEQFFKFCFVYFFFVIANILQ